MGIGVDVGLGIANLQRDISKATSMMQGFGSTLTKIGGMVAGAYSVSSIVNFTKKTLESADAMVENSQKVGIAATSLKLYSMMAEISGTDTKALMAGIGILSKNMAGLSKEGSGAQKALKEMGISTKDATTGALLPTEKVLMQVADKFSKMADGAAKTATAMALFGKSGKELIPFLNEGSKAFEDFQKRLEKLGVTFNEASMQKAAALNDELKIMDFVVENLGKQIVMGLVPHLMDLLQLMADFTVKGQGFKDIGDAIGTGFKYMAGAAMKFAAAVEQAIVLWEHFKNLGKTPSSAGTDPFGTTDENGLFSDASLEKQKSWWEKSQEISKKYQDKINALFAGSDIPAPKKKTGGAPDISNTDKEVEKLMKHTDQLQEKINDWNRSIAANNPLLTDEAKKIMEVENQADKLWETLLKTYQEHDNMSQSMAENMGAEIEAAKKNALAQLELKQSIESEIAVAKYQGELVEESIKNHFRQIDAIEKETKAREKFNASVLDKRIDEQVKYGLMSPADAATGKYQNAVGTMTSERDRLKESQSGYGDFGADPEVLQQIFDLETQIYEKSVEYQELMGSYDMAYSMWSQEHEALKGFAEAWGLTQEEIVTGTVDLWSDMGDLVTDLSMQMANSLTNVLTGLITGTVDVKKAMTSLVSSMLSSIVGMLIKVGMQYLITAMIGRGIQAASTAAVVASGLAITAAMTPAAIMASIATFGAADVAGMAGFTMALAGMGAEAAGLIGMFAGLGAAGVAMAEGGLINERVVGRGTKSGMMYEIGEAGPEYVVPANKMGGGGVTIVINGDVLNSHDELARKLIPAFRKAAQDGVR